jgi:hypothetical protein
MSRRASNDARSAGSLRGRAMRWCADTKVVVVGCRGTEQPPGVIPSKHQRNVASEVRPYVRPCTKVSVRIVRDTGVVSRAVKAELRVDRRPSHADPRLQ